MGIGNPAWLTTVKRAFRSPTKKSCKRTEECTREDEEEGKKTEKRRWMFRKLTSPVKQSQHKEERRAMAAAEATAEASTTQAAVMTANKQTRLAHLVTQHYAALIVQTAFRAYLARRALRALKGIVKLQALIRGNNVRKQAKMALKYMQAKMHYHYSTTPLQEGSRKSMYAETNNLWDKYKDIHQRTSLTMGEGNVTDQWEYRSYTIEDIEAMLQRKKDTAIKREKVIAYALSQQIQRNEKIQYALPEKEVNENVDWLKQWMETEKSDSRSISERRDFIKDIILESPQTPQSRRHSLHVASPMTPSFCNTIRSLYIQSASPRCLTGSQSQSTTTTPSLRSNYPSIVSNYRYGSGGATTTMPNYMAATESAKAKARSQSTPKHRSSVSSERSERVGSVKKRLSYPVPDSHSDCVIYNDYSSLTSPSFRSVHNGGYGVERGSVCSCYTGSTTTGGEISPASTSHVRRWFNSGNQE